MTGPGSSAVFQARESRALSALAVPGDLAASVFPEIVPLADPLEGNVGTKIARPASVQREREHLRYVVTQSTKHQGQLAGSLTERHPEIHAATLGAAQVVALTIIDPVMPVDTEFPEVAKGFLPDAGVQFSFARSLRRQTSRAFFR